MRAAWKKQLGKIASWVLTFFVMLIISLPGLWVVLNAFRPNSEILAKPAIWIPKVFSLTNFAKIFGFGTGEIAIPVPAYFTIDWAGMSAMAVIIIVPALLLTYLVQKHLIAGLTFGGVKG